MQSIVFFSITFPVSKEIYYPSVNLAPLGGDVANKMTVDFEFQAPVPAPSRLPFRNGIRHPALWLWDTWTCRVGDELSLFTLALTRTQANGQAIAPGDRNNFPFHVRRFSSTDDGASWRDRGAYLRPSGDAAGGVMAHNVWSGCATRDGDKLLFGFTGVRQPCATRPFVQSICVVRAPLDFSPPDPDEIFVISDPVADYDAIVSKGYYLGPRDRLGNAKGEDGGPILAWRDPFFLIRDTRTIDAFWSAKTGPTGPAVAHARLSRREGGFDVDLRGPIRLPDSEAFTQAEVPKIYHDEGQDLFYMLVSACNRLREGQPDSEVSKELRLYVSGAPLGDWRPYRYDGSIIPGLDGLFGASLADCDFAAGAGTLIAPYTEMVEPDIQLTVAQPRRIALTARETETAQLRARGQQ